MSDVGAPPLRPPALSGGDTIAVVSPSWCGPAEMPTPYRRGLAALRAHGFEVRVMAHASDAAAGCRGRRRRGSPTCTMPSPTKRVRAVLCTIGGLHSAQLLPLLDFDLIAANPKVFCGYSDITSLHLAIHGVTGLVTSFRQ